MLVWTPSQDQSSAYTGSVSNTNPFAYIPPRPSPLALRSANAFSTTRMNSTAPKEAHSHIKSNSPSTIQSSSSNLVNGASNPAETKENPFAPPNTRSHVPLDKRPFKPTDPLLMGREAARDKRKDLFLRKVQKERQEQRWNARSDEIMRLDYLSSQRKWAAAKERRAPIFDAFSLDEDAYEDLDDQAVFSSQLGTQSSQPIPLSSQDMMDSGFELDEIQRREQEEMEALVAMMDNGEPEEAASSHYGSDDEDYDALFMELVAHDRTVDQDDAMDMS